MKRSAVPRSSFDTPIVRSYLATALDQPWSVFAGALAVNAALAALLLYLEFFHGIDHWNLVRDTNAIAGQPAYFGFYSNLGILLWAAAAFVPGFVWLFLRNRKPQDERLRALGLGALFAAAAGLDDLFMLHENSYVIGISDKVVMAAYASFLLAFVASAVPVLPRTKWLLLFAALGGLAASVLLDTTRFPGSVLMEEVCKLTGISFLALYLLTLSRSVLADAIRLGAVARPAFHPRP